MKSPKPYHPDCKNKIRHPTAKAARNAIVITKQKNNLNKREALHVYQCPCCHGWHIGHKYRVSRVWAVIDSVRKEKEA
jgi:hypothetical protein